VNPHVRNFLAWVAAFTAAAVLYPFTGMGACLAGLLAFFLLTALVKRRR
jgi:hypothetical protein